MTRSCSACGEMDTEVVCMVTPPFRVDYTTAGEERNNNERGGKRHPRRREEVRGWIYQR